MEFVDIAENVFINVGMDVGMDGVAGVVGADVVRRVSVLGGEFMYALCDSGVKIERLNVTSNLYRFLPCVDGNLQGSVDIVVVRPVHVESANFGQEGGVGENVITSREPVLAIRCFARGKVRFLSPVVRFRTEVSPPLLEKGFQGREVRDVGVDIT